MEDSRSLSRSLGKISETCPMLNKVKQIINDSYIGDIAVDKYDKQNAEGLIEDIRQINYELRNIAKDAVDALESSEEQISKLEVEISVLQNDIQELQNNQE
jgi:hypothetical protein